MRILVLSDIHGRKETLNKILDEVKKSRIDLITICGDITNFGSTEQAKALLLPVASLDLPILYVPGNCDLPQLLRGEIEGAQNIHGSCVEIDDLAFTGVGGSPPSPLNTPLEIPEDEITNVLDRGLAKCRLSEKLVLVSHTPPFNTRLDLAFVGEHIGSRGVRRFVENTKPLAVFCGHVHEARGVVELEGTMILNPGPAGHGCYAVVDENGKIEARLECVI